MQARHGVPDGREHPLDLVLAAFVDAELDASGAEAAGLRGARRAVVELDPFVEVLERLVARVALDSAIFNGAPVNEAQAHAWIAQANALIVQAEAMAAST